LALAFHPDARLVHEAAGGVIHDLRFGQRLALVTGYRVDDAADVDQRPGLLAQVELGVFGQFQIADDLLRNATTLDQAELGLQIFADLGGRAYRLEGHHRRVRLDDHRGHRAVDGRNTRQQQQHTHGHQYQQQDDAPLARPDGMPDLLQVDEIAVTGRGGSLPRTVRTNRAVHV